MHGTAGHKALVVVVVVVDTRAEVSSLCSLLVVVALLCKVKLSLSFFSFARITAPKIGLVCVCVFVQ